MSVFKYFMKIDLVHEACYEGYCPSAASATQSEVKARVATSGLYFYQSSTAGHSQAVHRG